MGKDQVRRASDLLQTFLDRIGGTEGTAYVGLFQSWREIVGDRIADHTEPVDVRGTALVIEADHPGWVQMVMMSRQRIIKQLAKRYPEITITGLHIRVASPPAEPGKATEPGKRTASGKTAAQRTPTAQANTPFPDPSETDPLANITDDELRDSLSKLRDSLEDKE